MGLSDTPFLRCSTALLEAPYHPSAWRFPNPQPPLHVSRKGGRVLQISHRHSMTLFADEAICCPSTCLDGIGQRMRGEAAYLKAKCDRAEVIDVLA